MKIQDQNAVLPKSPKNNNVDKVIAEKLSVEKFNEAANKTYTKEVQKGIVVCNSFMYHVKSKNALIVAEHSLQSR